MSWFKASSWKEVPMEYKSKADFGFVEVEMPYGVYPTRKFRCVKQPALDTPQRLLGDSGSQAYTKKLKARVVPGSVVVVGPTVDAEDPTNVVVTDDGRDFYKVATGVEGAIHFTVSSAVTGPLGYKFTLMPQPLVYDDEDLKTIVDIDLVASFANNVLTVKLGREDSVPASVDIGAGNVIEVAFLEHGVFGNDWEVIIESDNAVVQPLAVVADEIAKTLTITLSTSTAPDASAEATFGSGDNGVVTVNVAGIAGNDYTVAVDAAVTSLRSLSASLTGDDSEDIVALLAVEAGNPAYYTFGSGDNGVVTVQVAGAAGNDYRMNLVKDLTELQALVATLTGVNDKTIQCTLATKPDAQAQAIIDSASEIVTPPSIIVNATIAGDFDGTVGNGVEVVFINVGAEGTVVASYDVGTNRIIVNFRGKADETAANIGTLINGITGFDGAQASAGNFTIVDDVGVTTGTLAGGTNQLDDVANTAILVAAEINALDNVTGGHSGTGGTAINQGSFNVQLVGGTNILNAVANTATLVATAINALTGVTATPSGTGETAITSAVTETALVGGTNDLDAFANTRTLVKTAIETLLDWAVDVGAHGAIAFTSADDNTYAFTDGYDGGDLDDAKNTVTLVRNAINALEAFTCTAVTGDGNTVLDTTDYVDSVLFNTYLVDADEDVVGSVNRTTGVMTVDFGAITVLAPYVTSSYYKFDFARIDNPTRVAEAHPDYTTVVVDLRGEGKIHYKAHPFSR